MWMILPQTFVERILGLTTFHVMGTVSTERNFATTPLSVQQEKTKEMWTASVDYIVSEKHLAT